MNDMEEIKQTLHTMMGMLEGVVTALGGLDNRVGRLEEGQATINCRLDKLEEGQADIVCRLEELEAGQVRLETGHRQIIGLINKLRDDRDRKAAHLRYAGGAIEDSANALLDASKALKDAAPEHVDG